MDDVRLANYLLGLDPGPIEVWRLDSKLAAGLEIASGTPLWLSAYTLDKIHFRHRDIQFEEYKLLPRIMREGFVLRGRRNDTLTICFVEWVAALPRCYLACVKRTKAREAYLTTFHRLHLSEAQRHYRKALRTATLLRPPESELARRLERRASST